MALFIVLWVLSPLVLIPMLIIYIRASKNQEKIIRAKNIEISNCLDQIKELKGEKRSPQVMSTAQSDDKPVSLETVEPVVKPESEPEPVMAPIMPEAVTMDTKAEDRIVSEEEVYATEPVLNEDTDKKPEYTRTSGVYMFGIGVVLVLIAGTIFATTTWNHLGPLAKIAVLLGAVAIFFASAWFAEKKLRLRETSITFFILGSGALAFINLAAGYFGWYGGYYKDFENGAALIWGITTAIIALCLLAGRWIYDMVLLSGISFGFALLTVEILTVHVTDDIKAQLISCGVFLIGSMIGASLYEKRFDCKVSITKIARIASFILICIATLETVFDFDRHIETEIKGALAFYAVGITIIILGYLFCKDRFKTDTGMGAIVRGLCIICFCMSDRMMPDRTYDLILTWAVLVLAYAFDLLKKRQVFVSTVFMQISCVITFIYTASGKEDFFLYILIPVAVIEYILQRKDRQNFSGIIPACIIYYPLSMLLSDILSERMTDISDARILGSILLYVIVFLTVIGTRSVQKSIFEKNEDRIRIEWLSIAALIPAVSAIIVISYESDKWVFWAYILLSLYFVSFYMRTNEYVQNILLTVAAVIFTIDISMQPFFYIRDEFISEWTILMFMSGALLISLIYRKHKEGLSYFWTVILAICFILEFSSISEYSYADERIFVFYKIAVYLAGVIGMFVYAYMRKNKKLLVETGFVLAAFSFLASSVDAKGIFILAALVGAAYMVYQHFGGLSKWSFLPVIQIYVLMYEYYPPIWAFVCAFIVSTLLGFVLHRFLEKTSANRTWVDDWINISGIIPLIEIINKKDDGVRCMGILLLAVFVLSFYRRYDENRDSNKNRAVLTASSLIVLFAWFTQPWLYISSEWEIEWRITGIMLAAVFNMIVVYRSSTDERPGWVTFIIACICSFVQLISAIETYELMDALFLGIIMVGVIIWSYLARKKQWFIMAVVTLALLLISSTRELWLSIAWWVYLLIAGSILIGIATANEYNKRHGRIKEKRIFFEDWTY